MAHRIDGRKLSRKQGPRLALYKNLAVSVLRYERVKTTEAKAKEIRGQVEHMPEAMLLEEPHPVVVRGVRLRGRADRVVAVPPERRSRDAVLRGQAFAETRLNARSVSHLR